ncbi:hypothetical protein N7451_009190 [Penicillium sp. IBT 35674x]|nr:hypothetical protein N7451_009190 [Penicillium sp. IBT 35674x]
MVTSTTSTASATTTASTDTITTVPMTGIFTPPASCSSSWTYEPEAANDVVGGLLMQNCVSADGDDTSCWPSGFDNWGESARRKFLAPVTVPSAIHPQVSLLPSLLLAQSAVSPSTSSMLVTIRQETGDSTEITGPVTMWGQPISIIWEKKDLSLFVSATTTSADSTTASGTTATSLSTASASTASATATAGSGSSSGGSSGGLSTGAGIGIGVGVGVAGVAGLAALALWFFMRKKRTQKSLSEAPDTPAIFYNPQNPNAPYTPPVNAHVPPSQPYRPTELDGYATREKHFHELDTS